MRKGIRDKELSMTYLALIGDVLRRQNKKQVAIQYMEDARDKAVDATHATQGHILQLLAYTYADIGNEVYFDSTIRHATDLLAFTGEGRDAAKKEFNPFEIYEIQGKAYRDLGKSLKAISFLDAAEKSLEGATSVVTPRFHTLLAISRGQAYCDSGDLSLGIDLAMHGFLLANRCDSARQMNRVRKLLKKLENSDSPHRGQRKVAELKDLVYETYLHMNLDQ
jgi:tetratricopeptide (TPR) repeat protein